MAETLEPTRMIRLDGGTFAMGSEAFYPDEGPVHERTVESFEIDLHPVTSAQYAAFVADTGYVTVAERPLDPADFPGADPADLVPGGLVFVPTRGPVDLRDWRQWWAWGAGASWKAPFGAGSSIAGREDHPVTQVALEDARAYAEWAGKRLPTEAEFEYAARGGRAGATYAWGEELRPEGRLMANTWQGSFPWRNTGAAGWVGTSPVGTFPANDYGLLDCIGNVWEWTTDFYTERHGPERDRERVDLLAEQGGCGDGCQCGPSSREETQAAASAEIGSAIPRRVLKGGSHLCAPAYCLRYRPAARSPQADDTATTHIGFRCVRSL
ncbi:formylglycine-generating enzyme family protein [Nocardioides albus]|uniref:Formylglycine-generating enzyme required for sulfatase activity n=1 Tax=Nocardioides albus TaxID=1841 RepID=A0A7W5A965_9ACTN|nr:formylglycine-generating enzyme family protein [Nocardioides albus]MBB3092026.1 formylglycine-generating enzyme required for sulfatase activity [Nocardioides albus]